MEQNKIIRWKTDWKQKEGRPDAAGSHKRSLSPVLEIHLPVLDDDICMMHQTYTFLSSYSTANQNQKQLALLQWKNVGLLMKKSKI